MKSPQTSHMLAVLAALAQESRLGVFRLLVEHSPDGLTAGDIAQRVGLPAATLSFHLKALAHADLVVGRAEGRFLRYRANIETMNALVAYLLANCCAQSTTCDPACAPGAGVKLPKVQPVPVEAIGRMPRKIARR
jgi:ArsR family transcriptional regulator, arsenate/arsenite/antimonite-responsive transcriptional repressor